MEVMEGYKQTEVGLIPEDWEVIRVGDYFEFKNGLNKEKHFFGRGTPIVNYMDVFRTVGIIASDLSGSVTLTTQELRSYDVKKGDVFFTRTSETVEEIGISSVVLEDLTNTVFSGFVLRARPKNSRFELGFKKYCFSSTNVRKQISSTSSYTTRALTNGRLLSDVKIQIPRTRSEQIAISTALTEADALITNLEKLIEKKKAIKRGAIQDLLKPKEGWGVKKLGEYVKITSGESPSKFSFKSSGIPYYKVDQLNNSDKYQIDTPYYINTDDPVSKGGDSDERDHHIPAQADHPFRGKLTRVFRGKLTTPNA